METFWNWFFRIFAVWMFLLWLNFPYLRHTGSHIRWSFWKCFSIYWMWEKHRKCIRNDEQRGIELFRTGNRNNVKNNLEWMRGGGGWRSIFIFFFPNIFYLRFTICYRNRINKTGFIPSSFGVSSNSISNCTAEMNNERRRKKKMSKVCRQDTGVQKRDESWNDIWFELCMPNKEITN